MKGKMKLRGFIAWLTSAVYYALILLSITYFLALVGWAFWSVLNWLH